MKILIIGLGSIAKKHIDALKKIDSNYTIYALRSNKNASQYLDVKNIFSFEEAQQLNLDFCIISSPTYKHLEDLQHVIELNIPVIIEKPIANNLEFDGLLHKIRQKNIQTYIACNLRFLDALSFVKKELTNHSSNTINEVNSYCGSYLPEWRPDTDYKQSYSANKEMGGGVHLDLIHELDYIYWLFGAPIDTHKILRSNANLGIDAIDYACYNMSYPTFNANIILNYFRRDSKRELEIVFEDFTIKVDLLENAVYKNNELIYSSKQRIIDTYLEQLKYFINHLNLENFNDIEEAREVLKICLN